jgi:hypothetical protein
MKESYLEIGRFIQENTTLLLSHSKVLAETKRIGGVWRWQETDKFFSSKARFTDFDFFLESDNGQHLYGTATLDRDAGKLRQVKFQYV